MIYRIFFFNKAFIFLLEHKQGGAAEQDPYLFQEPDPQCGKTIGQPRAATCCHRSAVWPGAPGCTSLKLGFLISKMGNFAYLEGPGHGLAKRTECLAWDWKPAGHSGRGDCCHHRCSDDKVSLLLFPAQDVSTVNFFLIHMHGCTEIIPFLDTLSRGDTKKNLPDPLS